MIKSEREKPMDFQHFVDGVDMPCCVMSVQKTAEDTCGEIRIIAANRRYGDQGARLLDRPDPDPAEVGQGGSRLLSVRF